MEVLVGELDDTDLDKGFLDTLATLAEVGLTRAQALEILHERQRSGAHTYVARLPDGRVVGTATLIVEQKFLHGGGRSGHVEDVAVHTDFQQHGIGALLVGHLTMAARRLGCYKIILNCFDHLLPFYGRQGYRRHDNGMRLDLNG